ncbi:MAG TPA: PHP domain-containing protein [Candidatus Limnocylindrales bacterium]
MAAYAELHCHTNFSFLDGASAPDELVARAVELGMSGLAVTDHGGLYGVVRFETAAREVGLRPIIGVEIELADSAVPDPTGLVIPGRREVRRGARRAMAPGRGVVPVFGAARGGGAGKGGVAPLPGDARRGEGLPARPRPERARLPGGRNPVKEDLRGIGEGQRGPHLVLLARSAAGYRSLCRLVSRANMAGTKAMPRFGHDLLAANMEGLVALSGCREGEIARRLRAGDREGARAVAEHYARLFAARRARVDSPATAAFFLEMQHHLLPDDDWLVAETARLAAELGLPVVVTNDVHYADPEGREMQDVLTAIRHGRSLAELRDLRRPDGESYLKSEGDLMALRPEDARTAAAWVEGIGNAGEIAAGCSVNLGFERYRFPGFPIPKGHTPFSYLEDLCHTGARRRYHPISSPVLSQLAHELKVIEKTGLAEFFLICWDIMRFAREQKIPAQGRGSAANSIVAYVLGITRVDPIRHNLLFERFINEGRTSYPDIDIDFSSERREEVIQYVYRRYGPEHTGMVCNLVTYRARSAVREVGYALGFPRPLVDRVAKALETYDSVMVRRDLEAEGGFGQFFAETVEREATAVRRSATLPGVADPAAGRGLTDRTGQLNRPSHGPARDTDSAVTAGSGPRKSPYISPVSGMGKGRSVLSAGEPVGGSNGALGRDSSGPASDSNGLETSARAIRQQARPQQAQVRLSADIGVPYHSLQRYMEMGTGREICTGMGTGTDTGSNTGTDTGADTGAGACSGAPVGSAAAAVSAADLGGGSATEQQRRLARRGPARSDDKGGPGDSPASIARLAADRKTIETVAGTAAERPGPATAPARFRPSAEWERWLDFCARIDGFPRHLSIHSGGMLVTAAPLIDIAPLERATMSDRVVVQFDKRDVETIKLIKLDLLGLGMLAAIDETLQLIEHDCGACVDLDRLPEDIPEVFQMLQAADTVGVFQVESRAQMQTLPKSKPANLDDLVVEVAIIRPGPIQGNAVHPYLRRRQGLEPVTYLHPSLEPVLKETLGVILYQEQVMNIAIVVAGFTAAESDGFRRAMGTWRSTKEMEKLHKRFVDGCRTTNGLPEEDAEELFRRLAAFASFGFAKSHAAAFARTAYESSFLKLFYQAQFTVGLINAQPMGFYPVEVLINDAKRHGVVVLPVDINASTYKTATEWVGPGRQRAVQSGGCIVPTAESRSRLTPDSASGYGIRLGLALVKGVGEQHAERLDAELARGPYGTLADVVARTDLPEEVVERLIRAGALDSLGRPRRELLWQLREVMGATRGSKVGARTGVRTGARTRGWTGRAAGRPADLRLPPTAAPELPALTEQERLGDSYAVLQLDARRQVISLFRPALDRLGAVTNASLADRGSGPVRLGGLVVTRQHPMTAKGTVFLALEDETGMVNVTLWPDAWARLRGVVRRHALLFIDGMLQREGNVVNVVAREIRPLPEVTERVGGPTAKPEGVRSLGYSGMRRS